MLPPRKGAALYPVPGGEQQTFQFSTVAQVGPAFGTSSLSRGETRTHKGAVAFVSAQRQGEEDAEDGDAERKPSDVVAGVTAMQGAQSIRASFPNGSERAPFCSLGQA